MKVTVLLIGAILVIIAQTFLGHSKLTSVNKSRVYSDLKNYQRKSHASQRTWILSPPGRWSDEDGKVSSRLEEVTLRECTKDSNRNG